LSCSVNVFTREAQSLSKAILFGNYYNHPAKAMQSNGLFFASSLSDNLNMRSEDSIWISLSRSSKFNKLTIFSFQMFFHIQGYPWVSLPKQRMTILALIFSHVRAATSSWQMKSLHSLSHPIAWASQSGTGQSAGREPGQRRVGKYRKCSVRN
jgi:hypothetical protein